MELGGAAKGPAGAPAPYILLSSFDDCAAQDPDGGDSRCKRGFSSLHGRRHQFRHVRRFRPRITRNINMSIFEALATIEGGEVVGDY